MPGAPPNPAEAENLCGILGSALTKRAGKLASGIAGETCRSWVESSEGMPLKAYIDKMCSPRSRAYLGALDIGLFVNHVEPGALVAVYEAPKWAPFKNGEEHDLRLTRPGIPRP